MSPSAVLRVVVEPLEDAVLIRVAGEVDLSNAAQVRSHLDDARAARVTTLVDLSSVKFMDSSGLWVLLDTARAAEAQSWAWFIVGVSGPVGRVIEVTGTRSQLPLTAPADGRGERQLLDPRIVHSSD